MLLVFPTSSSWWILIGGTGSFASRGINRATLLCAHLFFIISKKITQGERILSLFLLFYSVFIFHGLPECLQYGGAAALPPAQPSTVSPVQLSTKHHLLPTEYASSEQLQEGGVQLEWQRSHRPASSHPPLGNGNPAVPSDLPPLTKEPLLF